MAKKIGCHKKNLRIINSQLLNHQFSITLHPLLSLSLSNLYIQLFNRDRDIETDTGFLIIITFRKHPQNLLIIFSNWVFLSLCALKYSLLIPSFLALLLLPLFIPSFSSSGNSFSFSVSLLIHST